MELGQRPWHEKNMLAKTSDPSRMRTLFTPLGKLPRAKEWVVEKKGVPVVV
jgi:hypothetical protein